MEGWSVVVVLAIIGFLVPAFINIRSLVRKWRAGGKWYDMLFGILVWCAALAALTALFIKTIS